MGVSPVFSVPRALTGETPIPLFGNTPKFLRMQDTQSIIAIGCIVG
jgi:hypothetical protein